MKIDRHNYEEYFILYLDNELNKEERLEVEAFANAHPDLREELDILLQSKLVPDQHIVFEGREELLSFNNPSISHSNYEEWLVLYTDNELNTEQRLAVEKFAAANPSVQDELNLLLKTRLVPESSIVFVNKESLYRREEKTRPVVWWRVAAAAAVLIGIATVSTILMNNKQSGNGNAAGLANNNNNASKTQSIGQPVITNNKTETVQTPANTNEQQEEKDSQAPVTAATTNDKNRNVKSVSTNRTENTIASVSQPVNTITEIAGNNDNADPATKTRININRVETLTSSSDISYASSVTNKIDAPYYPRTASPDPGGPDDQIDDDGKKGKYRGFFRKVTRTFEKRTSIDATDGDDRLLLGALAIKLK